MLDQELTNQAREKIKEHYQKLVKDLIREHNLSSYKDLLHLWQSIHAAYLEESSNILQEWGGELNASQSNLDLEGIEADQVVVEVMDKNTGRLVRHRLDLRYLENHNGLVLFGETMEGKSTQIAFLTQLAWEKMNDMLGKGSDVPHHQHD